MNWILKKSQVNEQEFVNIEKELGVNFPKDFKDIVLKHNGASPRHMSYDTEKTKDRVAEYLLSFNKNDLDNIIDTYNMLKGQLKNGLIPIIKDPFGNYVCFDFSKNGNVVFWNHEAHDTEYISKTFSDFLEKLHD